jgi:hypothetical protein
MALLILVTWPPNWVWLDSCPERSAWLTALSVPLGKPLPCKREAATNKPLATRPATLRVHCPPHNGSLRGASTE